MGQLAVFRGSFTGEAAQQVTKSSRQLLAGLVKESLLIQQPGLGRYELHELLRQYAEGKLEAEPTDRAESEQALIEYLLSRGQDLRDPGTARQGR
jgi:hypothetical protein